jgi:pSer/pThr/pTyr-binding forkhead associated (FHA) protein
MSGIILLVLRVLLACGLYAFLGWVFYFLRRDVQHQGEGLAARTVPPITLEIESPTNPTRTRRFEQGEVTLGRDPDCDCVLSDEAASARHARLTYHHNQWWLEDLKSTNGTRLNAEPLTVATVIINGDKIGCGHATLTVSLGGANTPTPTLPIERP